MSYRLHDVLSSRKKKLKRKARDDGRRKDSFIAEYVRVKYPHIYGESIQYHDKLRDFYPDKSDLRKTDQFKRWKTVTRPQQPAKTAPQQPTKTTPQQATSTRQSESGIKFNMELNIPLWKTSTLESVRDINTVTEEVIGEGIYPSLLQEISPESVEHIIDQLRQDPDLENIFAGSDSESDQQLDQQLDVGAEVEIEEDTRLENELMEN